MNFFGKLYLLKLCCVSIHQANVSQQKLKKKFKKSKNQNRQKHLDIICARVLKTLTKPKLINFDIPPLSESEFPFKISNNFFLSPVDKNITKLKAYQNTQETTTSKIQRLSHWYDNVYRYLIYNFASVQSSI